MKLTSTVVCCSLIAAPAIADEPKLSTDQAAQVAELQAKVAVLNAETAVLKAQSELRSAKLSAFGTEIGKEIKGLSGQVTGGNNLEMALYASNRAALRQLVTQLCTDIGQKPVFIATTDVPDAIARHTTFIGYWDWIETKLNEAKSDLDDSYSEVTTGKTKSVVGAGVPSALFALDAAGSVIKGVAGIATLFKTEIAIGEKVADLVSISEVESELAMQPNCKATDIVYLDEAHTTLESNVSGLMARSAKLRATLAAGRSAREKLAKARGDEKVVKALTKSNKAEKESILAKADSRLAESSKLEATVESFQNALHTVDAASGISPLIAAAKNERVYSAVFVDKRQQLRLTVLRSSANSMTKKRLLLNDQVAYAGGVALRATIGDNNGKRALDTTYYVQSPWTKVTFKADEKIDADNLPSDDNGAPAVPTTEKTASTNKGT